MAKKYCVGVDIGGTTVKCGVFTVDGELKNKWEIPTRKEYSGAYILQDVAESLKSNLKAMKIKKDDLVGIGMGVPGPVEPDGHVAVCVNLGWTDVYPAKQMEELMDGIPSAVGNDANVAALGEMWQGGGKGFDSIVAITLGTGVGAGIIVHGKIVEGAHGIGGEAGHMHLRDEEHDECNCGGHGCLEQVASATGIVKEAHRILNSTDAQSSMRAYEDKLDCKAVCDCAKAGDPLAVQTIESCCKYLGWGLALISHIVDPEAFVIGGGVSKTGPWLLDPIRKFYVQYTPILKQKAQINLAKLGNDAGIYGAAKQVLD